MFRIKSAFESYFNDQYGFRIISGPKESIILIKSELEFKDPNLKFEIIEDEYGVYAQMRISGYENDLDSEFFETNEELEKIVEEIKEKHADVDVIFMNYFFERHSGIDTRTVCRSKPHSKTATVFDSLEEPSDFYMRYFGYDSASVALREFPVYLYLFTHGDISEKEIIIELKNGQSLSYIPRKNLNLSEKIENLKTGRLTIGYLSDLCCTVSIKKKKAEFIKKFSSEISTADIKKLTIKESVYSRNESLYEAALKLEDPSLALMLESYHIKTTLWEFDYEENYLHIHERSQMNGYNRFDYEIINLDEDHKSIEIPGIAVESDGAVFLFDTKNKTAKCILCLSDEELIEIPSFDPVTEKKVTAIDIDCFKGCVKLKKVMVPQSVIRMAGTYYSKTRRKLELVRIDDKTED